jgi:hypothetical protein
VDTPPSTSAKVWCCFADAQSCYLFIGSEGTTGVYSQGIFFGDIYSFVSADLYKCAIIARQTENNTGTTNFLASGGYSGLNAAFNIGGHFFQRGYPGTGGSTGIVKLASLWNNPIATSSSNIDGVLGYPHGPDGGLWLSRAYLGDVTTGGVKTVRGWLRGLWLPAHAGSNFTDGDTLAGTGALAGRTFVAVRGIDAAGLCAFLETSNTVEA